MKSKIILGVTILLFLLTPGKIFAKNAIVLSSFGTTDIEALSSILNIKATIEKTFPETRVELVFTSNIIRSIWQKRNQNPEKWKSMQVDPKILNIKGILETFGQLQSTGYRNIVVQPTHMFHMEQYSDLVSYVEGIASIKTIRDRWRPFDKIIVGRPALGTIGVKYPYHKDLIRVVKALKRDIQDARSKNSVLIYMGHGNENWSTGIYSELQKEMRLAYPDVITFVGCVEGFPSLKDVTSDLNHLMLKSKNILLKPLMIVAGDHAKNDMAGNEKDSWKSILKNLGYKVNPVLKGLGSNDEFVQVFIKNIKDAAEEASINLK